MPDADLTTLGGYRLVRKLGAGSRADVYLGVGSGEAAALKIFRTSTPRADIGRELDALCRISAAPAPAIADAAATTGPAHCVRLVDVATAASGLPAAILARVVRGSAAQLLRERESIELGEAVTLIAPVVGAMAAMHSVGVVHTRINASSVHLGAAGEPVLLGFGHVHLLDSRPTIAVLDTEPAAELDRNAVAAFVTFVLSHARGADREARVGQLTAWLDASAGRRGVEFATELESLLFELAEPAPIEFERVPITPPVVPARLGELQTPIAAAIANPVTGPLEPDHPPRRPDQIPDWLPAWIHDSIMASPAASARSRVATSLRGVRKPVWVVAAVVTAALLAAIALVPQDRSSSTAASHPPVSNHPSAPTAHETSIPTPTPLPDDPVLALPLLLAQRAECIRARSVLCLGGVEETSSGALADDSRLIRGLQTGAEMSASASMTAPEPTLVERLGDSALVALGPKSNPASTLMIRGEAGWRIRGFLSGKPAKSSG
jgi:serine/threonine protein kinase